MALATARYCGESARFRPGSIVDPEDGCFLAGPRRADLDRFDKHPAQHDIWIRNQCMCDTVDRKTDSMWCCPPTETY